ncbi:MAG: hypothetical protein BWK80_45420 [Desulfobacteraceae bacterium IS3]|jgi:hypothetical protein|nr:MAG: hypothetical protein BWK80_45420 [Desulfobacteraceae bacterium IS3]
MDISLSNEHRLSTRDKLYLCKNIMIFKKSQVENQIFLQALFSAAASYRAGMLICSVFAEIRRTFMTHLTHPT